MSSDKVRFIQVIAIPPVIGYLHTSILPEGDGPLDKKPLLQTISHSTKDLLILLDRYILSNMNAFPEFNHILKRGLAGFSVLFRYPVWNMWTLPHFGNS